MTKLFFSNYLSELNKSILEIENQELLNLSIRINETSKRNNKIILIGNGGSAAMASHVAVDFTKTCGIRAINFNEADLITCLANDYGYELWAAKALEFYADEGDLVILISSSGMSKNIINAAAFSQEKNLDLITFSGFSIDNNLKKMGIQNFWVNNSNYNIVEMTHHSWLLSVNDHLLSLKS